MGSAYGDGRCHKGALRVMGGVALRWRDDINCGSKIILGFIVRV